jgi:hypothetical protein
VRLARRKREDVGGVEPAIPPSNSTVAFSGTENTETQPSFSLFRLSPAAGYTSRTIAIMDISMNRMRRDMGSYLLLLFT